MDFTTPIKRVVDPAGREQSSSSLELGIDLPDLHPDQRRALWLEPSIRKVVRCGRRWGKTELGATVASAGAADGQFIGWFAPEYKFLGEAYTTIVDILSPVIWRKSSPRGEGIVRTRSRGRIDFWSLENERAGRSRKYHGIVIDEAAFTKPGAIKIWEQSIEPTLLDYGGWALVLSNTNGIDAENMMYAFCNEAKYGFTGYHAPSWLNPHVPARIPGEDLDGYRERRKQVYQALRDKTHPLVFQQEYKADFVDWSGSAFFSQLSLLDENAQPVEWPRHCDAVFATIDTAVKDRSEHDGTGVTYWAINQHFTGPPLIILDYDITKIEGSLLEAWLPSVYQRLEELARACRARMGSLGTFIEDKVSGTILLQQARRRGWQATPIESDLTKLGKDARCISVSGYVHQGRVKISKTAYDRVITYNGVTRNHLIAQVVGYRVGIDNKEDDLLDTFTYGTAIALGDQKGF